MSVKATTWAWEQTLPTTRKLVLLALADFANDKHLAWPSVRTLEKMTCMKRRAIFYALKDLEEQSLIKRTSRVRNSDKRQTSNYYKLNLSIMIIPVKGAPDAPTPCTPCTPEGHSGAPQEPSFEPSIEPSVSVESDAKEFPVKIEDVLNEQKQSNSKQKIFDRYKATPKGCADFWRDARSAAADDNGFQAELLVKEFKMLDNARKRVGDDFPHIVWKVMEDWVAFAKHAETHTGAYKMGLNPTVRQFCLHVEAAADFYQQNKPVQLTAKPLTKQSAPSKPKPKAKKPQKKVMTFQEAQAAFEEAHKK